MLRSAALFPCFFTHVNSKYNIFYTSFISTHGGSNFTLQCRHTQRAPSSSVWRRLLCLLSHSNQWLQGLSRRPHICFSSLWRGCPRSQERLSSGWCPHLWTASIGIWAGLGPILSKHDTSGSSDKLIHIILFRLSKRVQMTALLSSPRSMSHLAKTELSRAYLLWSLREPPSHFGIRLLPPVW